MTTMLTKKAIQQWCGASALQKGDRLNRAGKVRIIRYNSGGSGAVEAEVTGSETHLVTVELHPHDQPGATCSCPALSSHPTYCHHIAAVLCRIYDMQQLGEDAMLPGLPIKPHAETESAGSGGSRLLADRLLQLFDETPVRPIHNRTLTETRTLLEVEFILKVLAVNERSSVFGIELKLGPKSLYTIHKFAPFLEQLAEGKPAALTPRFGYDPEAHSFSRENEAVLSALTERLRDQSFYRESERMRAVYAGGRTSERLLVIPPQAWNDLYPLLLQVPRLTIINGMEQYNGLSPSAEPLPIHFALQGTSTEDAVLRISGLDRLTIMEPYGIALQESRLYPLPAKQGRRLLELVEMMNESGANGITIPKGQLETLVEKAIPGFKKLGSVSIDPAIAARMTQAPLNARLYLDRIKERLLAAVEFQYDEVVINPLDDSRVQQGAHRIVIRDQDKENRILELMEQCPFVKTESGYIMQEEEAEFDFLYRVVPELEKLVKVYATTAVKLRLVKPNDIPKVTVHAQAAERMNWLEFRLDMGWIPETEIRGLVHSLKEKRRYYLLPNGSLMPLDSEEMERFAAFLQETGLIASDFAGPTLRVPLPVGLPALDTNYAGLKLDRPLRKLLELLRNPDQLEAPVPATLAPVLREYQHDGYQWLKTLAAYGFGGILADDMGLGKTLQSIAFLASVLPDIRKRRTPALVIAPMSVVYNWRNELQRFAPDIRALVADGTLSERQAKLSGLEDTDVVITSYSLLLRDRSHYAALSFHTLVLDEAQAFKNHSTQTARAVRAIRAEHRFALTGTPIENRLEELWSIFNVVFPALFKDQKAFANLTQQEIVKRARPFMLRRWKRDVLHDLPEKTESMKAFQLLPEQKKLYAAYLAKLQQETLRHLSVDGYQKSRIKILAGLTRLRQICCHPALFVEGYKGGSAKLEQLLGIIEECLANRKRVLIFSQFTDMLALIGQELSGQGLPFFYLDGSTPARERVELCSRFNDGEMDVFLISLKAGGTGLNVTGADTVVLYDLWWNPAVEQQAADRVHRIGQKNAVQVIRLIAQDTLEEKMVQLQHKKKQLIDAVLDPGHEASGTLTEEDLRDLLMI